MHVQYGKDLHMQRRFTLLPDNRISMTNINRQAIYILAGIVTSDIRRRVASMNERELQVEDTGHPLFQPSISIKPVGVQG